MSTLHLSIVTPEGQIYDGGAKMVTLPGSEGEFGVLPGHADTVSLLSPGVIEVIMPNDQKEFVTINWGYAKVNERYVDVLVEGAVAIIGKDEGELAKAINAAKTLMEKASSDKILYGAVISKIESAGKQQI